MRHYPLVQTRYEREPDSVPGPFYVTADTCIICATPSEIAPANISWDESFQQSGCVGCPNHCRVSKQPETDDELELMIEAAYSSCVQAIRYCGTDAYTLRKFQELGISGICDALAQKTDIQLPQTSSIWRSKWKSIMQHFRGEPPSPSP